MRFQTRPLSFSQYRVLRASHLLKPRDIWACSSGLGQHAPPSAPTALEWVPYIDAIPMTSRAWQPPVSLLDLAKLKYLEPNMPCKSLMLSRKLGCFCFAAWSQLTTLCPPSPSPSLKLTPGPIKLPREIGHTPNWEPSKTVHKHVCRTNSGLVASCHPRLRNKPGTSRGRPYCGSDFSQS